MQDSPSVARHGKSLLSLALEAVELRKKATPDPWDCWDMDETGWHVFRARERAKGQHISLSIAAVRYGRSHDTRAANYFEQVGNAEFIAHAGTHYAEIAEGYVEAIKALHLANRQMSTMRFNRDKHPSFAKAIDAIPDGKKMEPERDIVDRLRNRIAMYQISSEIDYRWEEELMTLAAAEIERLRRPPSPEGRENAELVGRLIELANCIEIDPAFNPATNAIVVKSMRDAAAIVALSSKDSTCLRVDDDAPGGPASTPSANVFTPEQVKNLWQYQFGPWRGPFDPITPENELWPQQMHPFTCGNRGDHPEIAGDKGVLVPTTRGWICPICDYTQGWAHDFMTGDRQKAEGLNEGPPSTEGASTTTSQDARRIAVDLLEAYPEDSNIAAVCNALLER